MQKWEYRFVDGALANGIWRVKWINDKEISDWKNQIALVDYANKLGDDGWELVAAPYADVFSTNQVTGHIYDWEVLERLIFKRPKS